MKRFLPIILIITPFLLFKLFNLSVRLSDSNIYFYTGYQLLQGKILYRDIFFTNFPLIPYASAAYFLLLFGNLKLFFFTPAVEAAAVSFLIFLITYKQHKNSLLSALSALLYAYSFIVLATSDHQSGVFLASLFAVLSYYFFIGKQYAMTGVFIALALLTKAYFLPIFAAYGASLLFERSGAESRNQTKHFSRQARKIGLFCAGFATTIFIILLPTILFAFPDFVQNVFQYSLTRTQGVEKGRIIWFFLTHDPILFSVLLFNLYLLFKKNFFGFLSLFGILFFFLYQDIYYLYLNFLVPFLCLSFPIFCKQIQNLFSVSSEARSRTAGQKYVLPTILGVFLVYNTFSYLSGFKDLQKVNIDAMTQAALGQNPEYLYGINSLTPALSYTTGIPLLHGVIDTNPNIYRKGFLDAEKMTRDAAQAKAMIVGEGLDYLAYGVQDTLTGEIFLTDLVKEKCTLTAAFPVQNEGPQNRITFFQC